MRKIKFKRFIYEADENPIKGGVGDNYKADKKDLSKGIKVEKEHVGDLRNPKNKKIAEDIAKDHLKEYPEYYDELEKMENKLDSNKNKKTS